MSYLPVSAHTKRMPATPQPPGKASVWKASIGPDWSRPEYNQRLEHHIDGSRPGAQNVETLEHLVPESEREGVDRNGISRKLAWLAKNGFTVNTYDEIVASQSRVKPPKLTPKERRKIAQEELLIAHAEFEQELQRLERESPRRPKKGRPKKDKQLGPAWVQAPRGKYALEKQTTPPPRKPSEAPQAVVIPGQEQTTTMAGDSFDASAWLDSHQQQQQFDPSFLPEAMYPNAMTPVGPGMYTPDPYLTSPGTDAYSASVASPYSVRDSSEYGASSSSVYGTASSSLYTAYSPSISGSVSTVEEQYAYGYPQPSYDGRLPDTSYSQPTHQMIHVQPAQDLPGSIYQASNRSSWDTTNCDSYTPQSIPAYGAHPTWPQPSTNTFPDHTYPQYYYH
ncbi:hypothetical protein RhiJN_04183 [Ceratobasidium sp. AG-Ba]|nr:hypothetical protein RhiJN_04183 [Ceratobasidium sp. AG-Ba]QRW05074.1 hypothetical protein RhiLY_04073 [Ceratobasidium sp. AG-Ba]